MRVLRDLWLALVWGLAHRVESHIIHLCVGVILVGMLAIYGFAARSAAAGGAAMLLIAVLAVWLIGTGRYYGPPGGDEEGQ